MDFRDRYLSQNDRGKISPEFPIAVPTLWKFYGCHFLFFLFLLLLFFPVSAFFLEEESGIAREIFLSSLLFPLQMRIVLNGLHRSFYSDKKYVVDT